MKVRQATVQALTLSNMLAGFAALYFTMQGRPLWGAWLILVGSVLDVLDGMLARRWKVGSEMGVQLDSLADLVTFGVAPGLLLGMTFGPEAWPVWAAAALYMMAVAWRLARYNVKKEAQAALATAELEPPTFFGLPSPGGAGLVLAPLLDRLTLNTPRLGFTTLVLVVAAGLMVSTLTYFHTRFYVEKALASWRNRLIALVLLAIWLWAPWRWSLLFGGYALTGPLYAVMKKVGSQPQTADNGRQAFGP